ncbi:hypothetical protein L218DRAFT_878082 [Marasmius fiardii PR-910]|nr:hypothetical protein L218DRAFT_878082 [Marasmius fiardii PR-910]
MQDLQFDYTPRRQDHSPRSAFTVTSGRTARASHNRRKQEAAFQCPVPGCGSAFTRSFNLKGHMRSHDEGPKLFICHWPGCGKGFAGRDDCERHERLHASYRPFICEGCQKSFARMDALDRHCEISFWKKWIIFLTTSLFSTF